jgi:hypothetical protein
VTDDEIVRAVQPYTMTSVERIRAAIHAADRIIGQNVDGANVECGVWRGGSMMAMACALLRSGVRDRTLYLYDTFSGMTPPTARDVQFDGAPAAELLARSARDTHVWAVAALEDVRRNLTSTGYPLEQMRFVIGPVEETIPHIVPEAIAILRLDTDWYESTRHELVHLYPLLRAGGVLIVDDYGHWRGAKEATDEYFSRTEAPPPLEGIDYSGVLAVKPEAEP